MSSFPLHSCESAAEISSLGGELSKALSIESLTRINQPMKLKIGVRRIKDKVSSTKGSPPVRINSNINLLQSDSGLGSEH